MFSKEQFLESFRFETNICKHLYTKVEKNLLDYRPTEEQRSILELLQYLTVCGTLPVRGLLNADWSHIQDDLERSKQISADEFCGAMDAQAAEVEKLIGGLSEEELENKETVFPTGQKAILGAALVNFPLKFITAYRMQLFLYLKQTGNSELSTYNCWFGMDKPETP